MRKKGVHLLVFSAWKVRGILSFLMILATKISSEGVNLDKQAFNAS